MKTRSELDRFTVYFEAPPRGEEVERTIAQFLHSLRRGFKRVMPLMPNFGNRRTRR